MVTHYTSQSVRQTEKLAAELLPKFNQVKLLYLTGELGAGKTTLVQALAKQLGIDDRVTSPTYTIEKIYHADKINFYHLDLYRLKKPEELESLGLQDIVYHEANLVVIEWPELVKLVYGYENAIDVSIKIKDENAREFTIK